MDQDESGAQKGIFAADRSTIKGYNPELKGKDYTCVEYGDVNESR